jgi:hypothetical protein
MKQTGFYLGIMCLLASFHAWADSAYPVITYECNSAENILKIKNEVKWGDEGKNFPYSAATGTYNPWDWVTIVPVADGASRLVNKKSSLILNCKLGRDVYKVVLDPKIFNRNYDGNCGDRISVIATIYRGNNLLVDHQEFESYCHGNAPVVRGIKISADTGEVKVVTVPKFQFY